MIKKIWITGASSGIGEALAKKFAEEKWQVAASARRENLLQNLNKHNPNIHPFPLDVTDSNKTIQVFENIIKKLENIDICVFCTGVHDPQSEKKLNIESIRKIMEENLEEPLPQTTIARETGLSTRQLERLFRKYMSTTPTRYYLNLRLARARLLLRQTSMSILSVAMACGFVSASHFSKCYRECYGCTPRAERVPV